MAEKKPNIYSISLARGGSKGIPRKNVKNLAGKPLIGWTLDAAKEAGVFAKMFVSTDDEEIASVARHYGAEVPFLRPAELASDTARVIDVLADFAKWLHANEGDHMPDYLVLLQPTSPLRGAKHIKEAVALLISSGADSVVGVHEVAASEHPAWTYVQNKDGSLALFSGEKPRNKIPNRQLLPKAYRENGSFFGFRTKLLLEDPPTFYGNHVVPYIIDRNYAVDVDVPSDWEIVEQKMHELKLA